MLTSAKLRQPWYKTYIYQNYVCVCAYVPNSKFLVLDSGVINPPPPPTPNMSKNPLKSPPILGLKGHLLGPYVPLCPIAGEHEFFSKLLFDTLLHFLNCAKFQEKKLMNSS